MVRIELTADEAVALREILAAYLADFARECAAAEGSRERNALLDRELTALRLLAQLEMLAA